MKFSRIAFIFVVLFGSVGCDQVTKAAARQHLDGRGTLSFFGDTLRLTYAENYGAFLGLGSSMPQYARTLIFVGLVTLLLGAFLFWVLRASHISNKTVFASMLLIGGGVGNLIDRIAFNGGVTDFINLGIGPVRTGIFNVADVSIVAGILLVVLSSEIRSDLLPPSKDAEELAPS